LKESSIKRRGIKGSRDCTAVIADFENRRNGAELRKACGL
jgi:hypothetical protein